MNSQAAERCRVTLLHHFALTFPVGYRINLAYEHMYVRTDTVVPREKSKQKSTGMDRDRSRCRSGDCRASYLSATATWLRCMGLWGLLGGGKSR